MNSRTAVVHHPVSIVCTLPCTKQHRTSFSSTIRLSQLGCCASRQGLQGMKHVVHGNAMGSFLFLQCRAICELSYPLKVRIVLRFGCFL